MDQRCLQHDHHFDEDDLYDLYGNPWPDQIESKCTRCGTTMRQSLQAIADECRVMLAGHIN